MRPCVPWVVSWQKSLPTHLQSGVPRPRNKFGQAHEFRKLLKYAMTNDSLKKCRNFLKGWENLSHLEKNLDEDPGGAGGVVLVELDHAENPPLDRV